MSKGRLEAFSDGVLAIIITIMVLELKVPEHGTDLEALKPLIPVFLSYVLSFIFVGIYWNNHHHTFQAIKQIDGRVLWPNLHLLFWLSMIPFATHWIGETGFAAWPMAVYGVVLLMCAIAYTIMAYILIDIHGRDSAFGRAFGRDSKGWISMGCYVLAIPLAFVSPWISGALFVTVAIIWFIPDKRMERVVKPKAAE